MTKVITLLDPDHNHQDESSYKDVLMGLPACPIEELIKSTCWLSVRADSTHKAFWLVALNLTGNLGKAAMLDIYGYMVVKGVRLCFVLGDTIKPCLE